MRDRLPDGDQLADTATAQEQEAKQVLDRLDKLQAHESEFEQLLVQFITAAAAHIRYEENNVWPGMRAALSAQEADELGGKLERAKKTAPTRPHPGTPPNPGVPKGAGPAVAAADRLRDKASGRGQD